MNRAALDIALGMMNAEDNHIRQHLPNLIRSLTQDLDRIADSIERGEFPVREPVQGRGPRIDSECSRLFCCMDHIRTLEAALEPEVKP